MAHFYGSLQGCRGGTTRLGSRHSGLTTTAASWAGAIETVLYVDDLGRDCYRVYQRPWHGQGVDKEIANGVIGS